MSESRLGTRNRTGISSAKVNSCTLLKLLVNIVFISAVRSLHYCACKENAACEKCKNKQRNA